MKLSNISKPISNKISRNISHKIYEAPFMASGGSGPPPFDPDLSNIQSRILDGGTIWTDSVSSKYYLKDQSTDNTHLPRQGRCYTFDGSNDYGQAASLTNAFTGVVTVAFWFKPTTAASLNSTYGIWMVSDGGSDGSTAGLSVGMNRSISSANPAKLALFVGGSALQQNNTALTVNQWVHVCVVRSGSTGSWTYTYYLNGAADGSFVSTENPITTNVPLTVGRFGAANAAYSPHTLRDIRIYSSAKDSTAVAAIYNQSLTGNGVFDSTNLVACYPCNEESGTTGYDISGNGNHLTLTNITQATFHAADTGVLTNINNDNGYRLSSGVYIPKRLSDSLAADGNALTVTGRAAYHGCAEVPCLAGANTVYASVGTHSLTGDFELSFWCRYTGATDASHGPMFIGGGDSTGGTSYQSYIWYRTASNTIYWTCDGEFDVITIVNPALDDNQWHKLKITRVGTTHTLLLDDVVLWTGTKSVVTMTIRQILQSYSPSYSLVGNMADLQITYGGVTWYFPLQDGPGSSNTNRNLAYVKSDGTGGVISNAIVNGTVSTIWANRVPGQVKDWCIDNGGRIGAAGEYIAGLIGSANAADGNAKTLSAGKFGNPFSRLNLNPATAAEFNGRSIPTASAVAADINASVTPAESAFRRTDTDGDDRFLIYESALAGSDLTNVEAYVA